MMSLAAISLENVAPDGNRVVSDMQLPGATFQNRAAAVCI